MHASAHTGGGAEAFSGKHGFGKASDSPRSRGQFCAQQSQPYAATRWQSYMVIVMLLVQTRARSPTCYGTLVFSAAPKGSLIITANEALVRLPGNAATVAEVWIVNRKGADLRAARRAGIFV